MEQFQVGDKFTVNFVLAQEAEYEMDRISEGEVYEVSDLFGKEYVGFFDDYGHERCFHAAHLERIPDTKLNTESLTQEDLIGGLKGVFDTALPLASKEDLEKLLGHMEEMSGLVSVEIKKREEEANKFTQEDYERVVQLFRAQAGRKKFEPNEDNFGIDYYVSEPIAHVQIGSWVYFAGGLFQVYFQSQDFACIALTNVGAENILKAAKFEMEIGL